MNYNANNFTNIVSINKLLTSIGTIIQKSNMNEFPNVENNDDLSVSQLLKHIQLHLDVLITNVKNDMEYYTGKKRSIGQSVYNWTIGWLVNIWWWRSNSTYGKHHKRFISFDILPLKQKIGTQIKKFHDAEQSLDNISRNFRNNAVDINTLKSLANSNKSTFVQTLSLTNFIIND